MQTTRRRQNPPVMARQDRDAPGWCWRHRRRFDRRRHAGSTLGPRRSTQYLHHAGSPSFLALTALGVVYGDIGTSPLYAFQVALTGIGHSVPTAADVLGIV